EAPESSLLRYQLAVASHIRLGSSSSLSTQAWLVVVIEFVFRPAAPDSPSATPVVISGPLFLRRLLLPTLRQYRYDFNINSQLEHLRAKYVGTGHADLSRLEWAVNIKRDSYASYIGHYPMLAYFAIAENESIGRTLQLHAGLLLFVLFLLLGNHIPKVLCLFCSFFLFSFS
ncbi:unnamed protein product, partial [Brassica napus]